MKGLPADQGSGTESRAASLHRDTLVIDGLAGGPGVLTDEMLRELDDLDPGMATAELFREIERMQTRAFCGDRFGAWWQAIDTAGVDVLSISVGAWGDRPFSFRGAVQDLGEWHRRFTGIPRFHLVRSPADMDVCAGPDRTGVLLGFQDCAQLEGDLRNAETFHGLGVRMIQLTYNGPGEAGSGCTASSDEGLTRYGRDLVRVLNDLGIVVDVSHCGPRTTIEAIELSSRPVAASHAACAAIHPHARNKSDDILRALGQSGGYLGVCLVPAFLAPRDDQPSVTHFVNHVQHALDVCGPENVGIGSDWGVEHSPEVTRRRLQTEAAARGFRPADEFDFAATTKGFKNWTDGFPRLTAALLAAGLGEPTVRGVLGANFARYFAMAVG